MAGRKKQNGDTQQKGKQERLPQIEMMRLCAEVHLLHIFEEQEVHAKGEKHNEAGVIENALLVFAFLAARSPDTGQAAPVRYRVPLYLSVDH